MIIVFGVMVFGDTFSENNKCTKSISCLSS